jgi:Carboxypeptidase regulatory-like domain
MPWLLHAVPARFSVFCATLLLTSAPPALLSQVAAVHGTIADSVGCHIAGAGTVRVAGLDLGAAADSLGNYLLPAVPAGQHRLLIAALGFHGMDTTIVLQPGQRLQLDVRLRWEGFDSTQEAAHWPPDVAFFAPRRPNWCRGD